ncbi:MAG: very short patch repair endonuclease [Leptospirales bacterium]
MKVSAVLPFPLASSAFGRFSHPIRYFRSAGARVFTVSVSLRRWNVVGNPDFVFSKRKVAVFADGCFWHGHNCKNIIPKQNAQFWRDKLERNIKRDKLVSKTLRKDGWTVIRIWECEIKRGILPKKLVNVLLSVKK